MYVDGSCGKLLEKLHDLYIAIQTPKGAFIVFTLSVAGAAIYYLWKIGWFGRIMAIVVVAAILMVAVPMLVPYASTLTEFFSGVLGGAAECVEWWGSVP